MELEQASLLVKTARERDAAEKKAQEAMQLLNGVQQRAAQESADRDKLLTELEGYRRQDAADAALAAELANSRLQTCKDALAATQHAFRIHRKELMALRAAAKPFAELGHGIRFAAGSLDFVTELRIYRHPPRSHLLSFVDLCRIADLIPEVPRVTQDGPADEGRDHDGPQSPG